ncbi:MAG TPA: NAD(P)(+) transhydrogenase (Re/Si-specific) subunit beta [Polyangia bacterium]|nr:NAD(P)(+) transhydrogenase (Re/Si-specific) subunit beta [Polyangia bacterium]
MPTTVATVAYLVAAMLFIVSLRGLSEQKSAQGGNLAGVIGMLLAVAVSALGLFGLEVGETTRTANDALGLFGGAIAIGALIGSVVAARVQMTAMPELVAVLHSFVGVAAVLVGIGTEIEAAGSLDVAHFVEVQIGVFVGAVTFTGSLIAFAKLRGTIGSRPLLLPGRHVLNLAIVAACVTLGVFGYGAPPDRAIVYLLSLTGLSALLGVHLVWAIGGGDMPVVVSLLNSYSGWAAAAAGFMLENDLLIITGALVGSSGAILSAIMCRAMNRSIWNVVFGGFGAEAGAQPKPGDQPAGKIRETNVAETAELLKSARSVIVIPGYGMAVAQAQHPIREVSDVLRARGVNVRFAIHPVAGRLPGHMNVLLAEAGISYDVVKELDEINDDFGDTDVVVVIGANDIVNPSAVEDRASPIFGMPVLEAWKAARVVMLKRSMAAGYAGVENPLCYRDNTLMLFGDAKQTVQKLLLALQS